VDARGGAGGGHSAEHALVRVDVRLDRGVAAGVENLAADDLGDGGGRLLLQVLSLRVDGEDGDGARALAAFSQVRFDSIFSPRRSATPKRVPIVGGSVRRSSAARRATDQAVVSRRVRGIVDRPERSAARPERVLSRIPDPARSRRPPSNRRFGASRLDIAGSWRVP
jgi:hypothetical protein